jgi:hypothetical protein
VKRWIGVLAVAVVMAAPSVGAARTPQAHPAVVCPQGATSLAVTQPCCGPISQARGIVPCCVDSSQVGCCPPVVGPTCTCGALQCPPAVSIDVTPEPASEGQQTTISGTLTGTTPVAGQTVELWEKTAGAAAFGDVAQTQTNASGAYSFSRTVTTNAEWYAEVNSVMSQTVTQSVLAAVVLHASNRRPALGAIVTLSGTVAPSHAGETAQLQKLRGGRWVTVARPRLDSASHFTVKRRIRARARFRIVLAADADNASSVSAVVAINPT